LKKVFLFALIILITVPNSSNAASIKSIKSLVDLPYSNNDQVSDIAISGKNILLTGTTESSSSNWVTGSLSGLSDGFLISYTATGIQNWGLRLGNFNNEIATSIALDQDGSIWVVGASNNLIQPTPPINPTGVLNPDNVPINPIQAPSSPMNRVKLWQVSNSGSLINSFEYVTENLIYPKKLLVSGSNLIILGTSYSGVLTRGFFLSASKSGVFSNISVIGNKSTQINSAIINNDSSITAVGSSSEQILKAKPIAKVDAITLRISNAGVIQQVARATLKSTIRSWDSIDLGLLQGGKVTYSNKTEAAVTKFSGLNKPVSSVSISLV
jgi:hypothetical protein